MKDREITRREMLKKMALATGSVALISGCSSDSELSGNTGTKAQQIGDNDVFWVKNGTVKQNIEKLLEMIGGISAYVESTDVIVLKCNAQWQNQGYTNTECIKYIIDAILAIPDFTGEILICDNIQWASNDNMRGFLSSVQYRNHNWADHNWSTLAAGYRDSGKPVAICPWSCDSGSRIYSPADGTGWVRDYFEFHGNLTYLSYPIFESPLTSGRLIDMKNGIWENDNYTGRKVKTIFMPTLNNHGDGSEDYAGITSAIKCFFGATEIQGSPLDGNDNCHDIHTATYSQNNAFFAGELAARYINKMYAPVLYLTCAIWSGHQSRWGEAIETKTVLACKNPATLDYISCRDIISPYASWLNPDNDNNTRLQILGCISGGIGTIDSNKFSIKSYDFNNI